MNHFCSRRWGRDSPTSAVSSPEKRDEKEMLFSNLAFFLSIHRQLMVNYQQFDPSFTLTLNWCSFLLSNGGSKPLTYRFWCDAALQEEKSQKGVICHRLCIPNSSPFIINFLVGAEGEFALMDAIHSSNYLVSIWGGFCYFFNSAFRIFSFASGQGNTWKKAEIITCVMII